MRPFVVVTVGTDHHPFDRLVRWTASWAATGRADVLLQHGTSAAPAPVEGLDAQAFLPAGALEEAVARADVVVCHGGPATILQARHAGRLPVVVPRRADLGEHVDNHQVRFATWMAERGNVSLATTEAELHAAVERGLADPTVVAGADRGRREAVSAVFGDLVDALVADRRERAQRPR